VLGVNGGLSHAHRRLLFLAATGNRNGQQQGRDRKSFDF
jgi:hypothetical protein